MTDQEINVAIAEVSGFGFCRFRPTPNTPKFCDLCGCHEAAPAHDAPSYCTDLNAMHEVLTTCLRSLGQMENYRENLRMVLTKHNAVEIDVTACALHCAEAFLRTIGKWKE